MGSYVALDVSLRSTSVHIVDETGKCLWRGKCASEPKALAALVRTRARSCARRPGDWVPFDLALPYVGRDRPAYRVHGRTPCQSGAVGQAQ